MFMKKVVTFGVFDLLHIGHFRLFERCKKLGDYLIVAVHSDKYVRINKPNCNLYYDEKTRIEMISAIKYVDETILYNQIDEMIKNIDFDVLVVGPDQTNPHFINAINYVKSIGKEVVVLSRTKNVSSTELRKIK